MVSFICTQAPFMTSIKLNGVFFVWSSSKKFIYESYIIIYTMFSSVSKCTYIIYVCDVMKVGKSLKTWKKSLKRSFEFALWAHGVPTTGFRLKKTQIFKKQCQNSVKCSHFDKILENHYINFSLEIQKKFSCDVKQIDEKVWDYMKYPIDENHFI